VSHIREYATYPDCVPMVAKALNEIDAGVMIARRQAGIVRVK